MEEKNTIKVSLGTTICIVIIVLLIVILGIVYYLGFIKDNEENLKLSDEKLDLQNQISSFQEDTNIIENEVKTDDNNINNTNAMTKEEAVKIAQDIYNKAYNEIEEGIGLTGTDTINITAGEEGTVGGIINVEAYKLDFSKIETYFTDRAINYIKTEYTDTPYGYKDGNYYIYATENQYSYNKKEFINTIFGVTDQEKRTLNVETYDDDMIVAISNKSSFFELDEYLILKKVNNTWKIDMFEEL
jgi:hypothetical protein